MRRARPKAYKRVMRHHPSNAFAGALFTFCLLLLICAF